MKTNFCSLSGAVTAFVGLSLFCGCSSSDKEPKNIMQAPTLPEEELLQNATDAYDRGLYSVSLQPWTELRDGYPSSYYSTLAELKIADAHFYSGEYPTALSEYEEFAKMHSGHEAMPYVRYQVGRCHLEQYRGKKTDQGPLQTAIKTLSLVIAEYPNSEYAVLSKRELDRAHEYLAEYEAFVAEFYLRRGYPEAAAKRYEVLKTKFPGTKAVQEARESLGDSLSDVDVQSKPAGVELPRTPKIVRITPR
jgi:outer membrane protein assembly factor BamD